jgi:hypothetical protein
MSEAILHFPNTPSWRGAQLKHRDNFTFTFIETVVLIMPVTLAVSFITNLCFFFWGNLLLIHRNKTIFMFICILLLILPLNMHATNFELLESTFPLRLIFFCFIPNLVMFFRGLRYI